jgi:acetyltransferase
MGQGLVQIFVLDDDKYSTRHAPRPMACFLRYAPTARQNYDVDSFNPVICMDVVPTQPAPQAAVPPLRSWYPVRVRLRDGTGVTIRPIGPDDAEREQAFVRSLSSESRYNRFMNTLRELPPDMLHRFTHPDFEHDLALVALDGDGPDARQIGVARVAVDPDADSGEFAIVVADAWQNRGVGKRLMCELLRAARALGLKEVWGDILASNRRMSALMASLGFTMRASPDDPLLWRAVKVIDGPPSTTEGN